MPHADASLVPAGIETKPEFWEHVHAQLQILLEDQKNWVTNLANASSLIFNALVAFPKYFGSDNEKAVNWCGFYIDSGLYPSPRYSISVSNTSDDRLLLAPFCGKPACQFIHVAPGKSRGVCADAYLQRKTIVVPDVNQYPGHIACDGETKSEIVVPLIYKRENQTVVLGVLDLDCLAANAFNGEDKKGLEKIAKLIVDSSDW